MRNAFTYVVMAPLSPLIAVAVIGDGLRLQNLVLAWLGLVSLVAIGTWFVLPVPLAHKAEGHWMTEWVPFDER